MATSLYLYRRFLVLAVVFAMMTVTLLVTASSTRASHFPCSGEASYVDLGGFYLVKGTKGDDWIDCSASDKSVVVQGGFGDDWIWGSDFDDTLKGGWGDDWLYGGDGSDWLLGGQDDDYMDGQGDTGDVCLGGQGWDSFGGSGCETADQGPS